MHGYHSEDIIQKVQSLPGKFIYPANSLLYLSAAPSKPNQDSYSIVPQLNNNSAFFAVYDGHGKDGHDCAYFCRDHVIRLLSIFMLLFEQESNICHLCALPSSCMFC